MVDSLQALAPASPIQQGQIASPNINCAATLPLPPNFFFFLWCKHCEKSERTTKSYLWILVQNLATQIQLKCNRCGKIPSF